jgi:hypothetical protein
MTKFVRHYKIQLALIETRCVPREGRLLILVVGCPKCEPSQPIAITHLPVIETLLPIRVARGIYHPSDIGYCELQGTGKSGQKARRSGRACAPCCARIKHIPNAPVMAPLANLPPPATEAAPPSTAFSASAAP